MSFYIHEDDWGRVSLEPDENRNDRARVSEEVRAFGEAHRAPGGIGWTDLMVVPASPVEITVRRITLPALRELLGPTAIETAEVTTGYASHREPVTNAFAFRCSGEPFWNTLYGCVRDGTVTQLHLTHATPMLAPALHRLGSAFRLILCDFSRDGVVDLAQRAAIDRYLTDED